MTYTIDHQDNHMPCEIEINLAEDRATAEHNILLDDELAREVATETRLPTIRVWRHLPVQGLVVSRRDVAGANGPTAVDTMRRRGWSIYVRPTGGTAVPHGEGVLNLSLLFPRTREKTTTDGYYRVLCGLIVAWLETIGLSATTGDIPGSYCDGTYNVIVDGKKLVGTAQAWRGGLAGTASRHPGFVLAHACIMVNLQLAPALTAINDFYELIGDSYRVQPTTSVTLSERLEAHGLPPMTSAQAKASLAEFLGSSLRGLGIKTHSAGRPDADSDVPR